MRSRLPFVIALLVAATLLAGCFPPGIVGSGRSETRDYDVSGFTGIDANNGFQVELTPGDNYKVTVTADDNLTQYLVVEKRGNNLTLGLQPNRAYSVRALRAQVTMPNLTDVSLSGGARLTFPTFRPDRFNAELSGGSRMEGTIETTDMRLNLSGGSQLNLKGTARTLSLDGSGGSRATMDGTKANDANVNISGGSQATVGVSGSLNYDLSGGSRLNYIGSPTKGRTNASGGSQANQQ